MTRHNWILNIVINFCHQIIKNNLHVTSFTTSSLYIFHHLNTHMPQIVRNNMHITSFTTSSLCVFHHVEHMEMKHVTSKLVWWVCHILLVAWPIKLEMMEFFSFGTKGWVMGILDLAMITMMTTLLLSLLGHFSLI